MLRDLHVRNLAVISEASVEFGEGFNVLTGETGAGKSIVVDSLALLRGARASTDLVRSGTDKLVVSGRFDLVDAMRADLAEAGVEIDDEDLLVRREIGREGKNRAFINDQPVTLKLLRQATEPILHIHAQREELGLATPEVQRGFVDASGGDDAKKLLRGTAAAHETWAALAARLDRVRGDRRLHSERVDLLRFQLSEIEAAGLVSGEDSDLAAERDRLRNSEQIAAALGQGHLVLSEEDGAVVERLARVESSLTAIGQWETDADGWVRELEEARIRLTEVADSLRRGLDRVSADPRRLDEVEERLALLDRLCRKYGETVDEVLSYRAGAASELEELEGDIEDSATLQADVASALEAYTEAARKLSAGRKDWARELVKRVEAQFGDLALARARLSVELSRQPEERSALVLGGHGVAFGADGFDQIELFLAANPGEAPRPLATSASGGELSRIYLAMRLAVRQRGEAGLTMVFDEADAGLGGEAASALGRKLRQLAGDHQILAVTHLPQVASFGHRHLGVLKRVEKERTRTTVERLHEADRIEEIARMLAGDQMSDLSLSHAEALIEASKSGS